MPTKINFVGPSLTECILVGIVSRIKNDQRKSRERELATFDENRRAAGMLNEPYARKKVRHVPGERRDSTCDHGLSRRSLRENLPRVKLESKSDDKSTNIYILPIMVGPARALVWFRTYLPPLYRRPCE